MPRFQPAGLLFGTTLPASDWDIIMYTWNQDPASKITSKDLYACGGELNYGNYCNRKVTALLNRTAVNLDEAERTKLLNQAEALMANDIPSIPMFVRPVFAISSKKMKGMTAPTTLEGSTLERERLGRAVAPRPLGTPARPAGWGFLRTLRRQTAVASLSPSSPSVALSACL